MSETVVTRLKELYKILLNLNGLHNFEALIDEDSNRQTALALICECEKLILIEEKMELTKLNKMHDYLKNLLRTIDKVKAFQCNCEITMRYLNLHAKSLMGLDNRLPELEENIEVVMWMLQKLIKSIIQAQQHPNNIDLYFTKKVNIMDLFHIFDMNKYEYEDFHERFDCLFYYLENKRKTCKSPAKLSREVVKYLNGKSDMFMTDLEWEDEDFINDVLGGSTEQIQNLLRNSLKEVMKKRGFNFNKANMLVEKRIRLSEERENLFERLDIFRSDLMIVREGIQYFQRITLSPSFHNLQKFQLNLHELKIELDEVQEQNNFSSDEDL